jgi:hypothetical protein
MTDFLLSKFADWKDTLPLVGTEFEKILASLQSEVYSFTDLWHKFKHPDQSPDCVTYGGVKKNEKDEILALDESLTVEHERLSEWCFDYILKVEFKE